MKSIQSVQNLLQNTFDYKSGLKRADFWWGYLGYIIISVILAIFFILLSDNVSEIFAIIGTVILLFLELSIITTFMRRLNDAGINKGFAFLFVIPLGILVLLFLLAQPSKNINSKNSE